MKYFTPELYLRFNSRDRAEVANAHEEWEGAMQAYRRHLRDIGPRMNDNVREFADSLCLHDGEYLGMAVVPLPDNGSSVAMLLIRQDVARVLLVYFLTEQPLTEEVKQRWPFSKERVHWLYDEFDVGDSGAQQHEMLLSNGRIVTLRFHKMQVMRLDIDERVAVAQQ
ncbi:MAG TPA: hypothetical protein VGX78_19505 [Pirellulales bacterium]|jgi:hypothetical protein|nr:hypothetical protein [Pirellulales bacterium]